jgi:hypothetical protein
MSNAGLPSEGSPALPVALRDAASVQPTRPLERGGEVRLHQEHPVGVAYALRLDESAQQLQFASGYPTSCPMRSVSIP